MNTQFAERFKSARLMNGMSLQDLATALDNVVSRQALHRYEKGEVMPNSELLSQLCHVLDVRPDYFFRDNEVSLGKIEYRKLTGLSVKEESKILGQTEEYLSRYLELEDIIGIESQFSNPLENISLIESEHDIEDAAQKVRSAWRLGDDALYNVSELLEDNHVKVVKVDADLAFDGLQTWVNETIPVVAFNSRKLHKPDRIRFTLLHELGHLLLENKLGDISDKQKERFCHQFAGALLMPKASLIKEIGLNRSKLHLKELINLKKQYGISLAAIVMRAYECGIINKNYKSQFFFLLDQMDWRIDEPGEYAGVEESGRFEQLIYRAIAEELISLNKAASLQNKTLADFRSEMQIM